MATETPNRTVIEFDALTGQTVERKMKKAESVAYDAALANMLEFSWQMVRSHRNALLAASDWTQIPDADLSDSERSAWSAYRQALRDLPSNVTDPDNDVVWPEPPK